MLSFPQVMRCTLEELPQVEIHSQPRAESDTQTGYFPDL